MTPVLRYIRANRGEITGMDGVKGLGDITKKGAELYNALPEEEKAKWQTAYEKAKKAQTAKDPAVRKKPMTPVFKYIQANRGEITGMDGVKGLGDITKKGAELYNALPEEDK